MNPIFIQFWSLNNDEKFLYYDKLTSKYEKDRVRKESKDYKKKRL